ncbi:hypothetical protein CMV_026300 [Castanea mollissima]|uniref:Uncharacterized protein n=1 Tax=Castanea mollissima TaxID=60419 RepID=A0A8J4QBP8_9ROSI|nr:hypothetical protein CMV_026300 [Castanea mollissima]
MSSDLIPCSFCFEAEFLCGSWLCPTFFLKCKLLKTLCDCLFQLNRWDHSASLWMRWIMSNHLVESSQGYPFSCTPWQNTKSGSWHSICGKLGKMNELQS